MPGTALLHQILEKASHSIGNQPVSLQERRAAVGLVDGLYLIQQAAWNIFAKRAQQEIKRLARARDYVG